MTNKHKNKLLLLVVVAILVICLIIKYFTNIAGFIGILINAISPIIIGCIVAYALNILLVKYEHIYFPKSQKSTVLKSRRPVCILLSIFTLLAIILFAVGLVIPEIYKCAELIYEELPYALDNFKAWVNDNIQIGFIRDNVNNINLDMNTVAKTVVSFFENGSTGVVNSVISFASSVVDYITTIIIAVIFAIYALYNKEKLAIQFNKITKVYFKQPRSEKFLSSLKIAHETFSGFISGQCVEAVILGVLCFLGMTILRFPYAGITGIVVGLTALIPIVGALIGAVVGAFLIFTVSPIKALLFLIFLVLLQQCEEAFIYPKVVGKSIGLPGIWVLTAVTVGGGLFGVIGMLFGVPIFATIYKILQKDVKEKIKERNIVIDGGILDDNNGEVVIKKTNVKINNKNKDNNVTIKNKEKK